VEPETSSFPPEIQVLSNRVLKQICHLYCGQVEVITDGPVGRPRLQFHQGLVCVLVSRCGRTPLGRATWCVNPVNKERHSITLLCRCTRENNDIFDYHLQLSSPTKYRSWQSLSIMPTGVRGFGTRDPH